MALDLTTGVRGSERERPSRHTVLPGPSGSRDERPREVGARRPDIQGLRAVAVLLVVGYHAGLPLPGGFVGVDVFFVISGFVITGMLLREWAAHGRVRFARFYVRRVKRLTPALALMVCVTLVLSTLLLSPLGPQQATAQTAAGAMFLVANAVIARTTGGYFDGPAEQNALLHTWSLSVEEQFYLVFPLLLTGLLLLGRRRGRRSLATAAVALVSLGSFLVALVVSLGWEIEVGELLVGFYGPLTRVWEFGAGALLALSPTLLAVRTRLRAQAAGAAGVALLLASVVLISERTAFPGPWTLLPVAATMLLIRSGEETGTVWARWLRSAPMARIGDWSYSIYLWHWPFIVFATALWPGRVFAAPAAAMLSFGAAVASFRLVEDPVRRWEPPNRAGVVWLVTASLGPPVLLAGVVGLAVGQGYWSSTVKAHQSAVLEVQRGCHGFESLGQRAAADCTWNGGAPGAPIYLIGDSHARHFGESVIRAGESLGRPVVIATASACPLVDIRIRDLSDSGAHERQCGGWVEGTLSSLATAKRGTVVMSASDLYWRDPTFAVGTSADAMATATGPKLVMAQEALRSTIGSLTAAGHDVVLVQTVPRWDRTDAWSPGECTVLGLLTSVGSCEQSMPVERAIHRQGRVRDMLVEVSAATGSRLVDPWQRLCPDGLCSTHGSMGSRYKDTNHITARQSAEFAEDFRQELAAR